MLKEISILFIFSFLLTQSCLAQDDYGLASLYKPKNKTERLAIAKIRALPEVKGYFEYTKRREGKPDFIINPPGFTGKNCYAMQVGIDYGDSFRTIFWLLIDPKTFKIYYLDFDDEGMEVITLQQSRYWRKRPEFHKPHKWVNGKFVVVKIKKRR